jgi:uncharacterized Zn-binding protein involved in type VI secretion
MPLAARGDAVDTVDTVHPASGDAASNDGSNCDVDPIDTSTDVCSEKVFAMGTGVVRFGDAVTNHIQGGLCTNHAVAPTLNSGSGKVKIEGKKAGRKGDTYSCTAEITTGASKVNIG